jgi:hypothetical protein
VEVKIMKAGRNLFFVAVLVVFVMSGASWALEVLEPGYVVETYVSYSCPGQGEPRGIAFDPYGNLYLSNWDNYPDAGSIYRISPDKSVNRWIEGLGTPRVIVWTGGTEYGDYLYVTDATPSDLLRIDLDGTVSTFSHVGAGPHSLGLDTTGAYGGYLYVATRNPDHIYYVSETGQVNYFSYFPGSVAGGHVDLAFDPGTDYGGLMYVALEGGGHTGPYGVFTIDQAGHATEFAPVLVTAFAVEIDPYGLFEGSLFVTGKWHSDQPYYSMWRAHADGHVTEFAVGTIGTNHLLVFAFGPDGAMYVPEYSRDEGVVVITRITAIEPYEVAIDIKPGSCPNPLNVASGGVLPVAILGSQDFDVTRIDVAPTRLAGAAPVRSSYEDVAAPAADGSECECATEGPDGYIDLTLKFKTQQIVNSLGEPGDGETPVLTLTGVLTDGTPIEGTDCIVVGGKVPRPLAAKKSDINKDGIVNAYDLGLIAKYWLEPAVVEY